MRRGASLTALDYHFWTQPLPTPLAWHAAQLPPWLLAGGTAATLAFELGVVFLIFLPRRPRAFAACCVLLFQLLILLTGNYNFFNLLSMLICVFLFDDAALRAMVSGAARNHGCGCTHCLRDARPRRSRRRLAFLVVPIGVNRMRAGVCAQSICLWSSAVSADGVAADDRQQLRLVRRHDHLAPGDRHRRLASTDRNGASMSSRYKPGPLARQAPWNIPHQPRLDWQMWFAALGDYRQNPWFAGLMLRLLQGSPPVLALLDANPFPEGPPKFVRARLYDYRSADDGARARRPGTGGYASSPGWYFPQVSLADFARVR